MNMKTIADIYAEYKIMPTLQLHQLRVAAVAKIICNALGDSVDEEAVITTCLLHDMGNIIKFNLSRFPEFLEPEGLEYWQGVKDDFVQRYGNEEHIATYAIAQEIGISEKAYSYLREIGFSQLDRALKNPALEQKICSYADMRVGPHGVISTRERIADGLKRYAGTSHTIASGRAPFLAECLQKIEETIFEGIARKPTDITDKEVVSLISVLQNRTV